VLQDKHFSAFDFKSVLTFVLNEENTSNFTPLKL